MARNLLVENAQFGTRAVIDPVNLRDQEVRGWVGIGLCSDPTREPLLTDEEFEAAEAAEAARIAALLKNDAVNVGVGIAHDATVETSTHDDEPKE